MRTRTEIVERFGRREDLGSARSFFFVGIGGAGMSSLARMLARRGFAVAGSDGSGSAATQDLVDNGIPVRIGHTGAEIGPDDALIVSDAIDLDSNPDTLRAREIGAPTYRRSQLLGHVVRNHKVIAVTGTHGKTTTTGMIGAAMLAAGMDPLIVVGAAVPEFGGAVVEGNGEWAVVEACEAYDSLRDIDPTVVVLTNLELDHIDFHGNFENLRSSIVSFANRIPANGALIYCSEDVGAREVADLTQAKTVPYSPAAQEIGLKGRHQRLNAGGALAAVQFVGADMARAQAGVARFQGAERRLQVLLDGEVAVVDDYAHTPTEIAASVEALRAMFPDRRLVVVFQPHLYSRTAPAISEFAAALTGADEIVLTDIYPAREAPAPGVSSALIADLIAKPVSYVPSRHLLPRVVAGMVRPGDVICAMGAGNIADFAPDFLREMERGIGPRIAVLFGGDSAEREVSIHSGLDVHAALVRGGYDAELLDVTEALLGRASVERLIGPERPDLAFLALHGTNAEDGAIQGFLELLHIPYTGSGVQSSALAMDKRLAKQILEAAGLRCPKGWSLSRGDRASIDAFLSNPPTLPLVVKPNAQGSTVGLSFVESHADLAFALRKAFEYGDETLVEERVVGMEVSVPVLGDRALPPVEIAPGSGRYDFAAKYTPGATEEIVPARLPEALLGRLQEQALTAHQALRCRGATRTDMMVQGEEIFVLEVNTLPGMTGTSLLPNSARAAGITFDQLVKWMVEDGLRSHGAKT